MLKSLLNTNKPLALMLIKAQKEVFSKIVGENNSRTKGSGYDFIELREYESGDDIKHIDWIISSKMDKPHVKVFHQQRELNIVIAPILSGSVHFGTKVFKKALINEVSTLIAYSCVRQNDPFESLICNDDVMLNTKKTKQLFGVRTLAEKIDAYDVLGKGVDYKGISQKLFTHLRQRSLLFLIGDFFDTQELDLRALSIKHELIVIIIRDRFEEDPLNIGELNITDPITQKTAHINLTKTASQAIAKNVFEEDEILFKKLKKSGIKFVKIYTDENPAQKVLSLMSAQ